MSPSFAVIFTRLQRKLQQCQLSPEQSQ